MLVARAPRVQALELEGEERRHRAQIGEVQAHRRVTDAANACVGMLESELQRRLDRSRRSTREVRSERESTDRHETESRLLRIKVRNLEGVASTVQAVGKEYRSLEAREERTKGQLAIVLHELGAAEGSIAAISQTRALGLAGITLRPWARAES